MVYSESENVNFRYINSSGEVDYANIKKINDIIRLIDTRLWGTNGSSINFSTTKKIYAASTNPNIKPSQGIPSGLSEYGSILSVGANYGIILYTDVFGRISMYATNPKKWVNAPLATLSGTTLTITI